MHKFILGENPQAPDSGGLWIIHLPDPKAIIEAVHDADKVHSKKATYSSNYQYVNSDGITENWQLRLYHYFTTGIPTKIEGEALAQKMLFDAWHWFVAYLKWEDNNIDLQEYGDNN